jgi:hypothetical protein
VNQISGEIRSRHLWIPQADLEAADGWTEQVDQAVWDITG